MNTSYLFSRRKIAVIVLALSTTLAFTTIDMEKDYEFTEPGTVEAGERYVNLYEKGQGPVWLEEPEKIKGEDLGFIYEVTRHAGTEPTEKDFEAAWSLYNQSFEAAEENGWFDFENATEDGFIQLNSIHWAKPENLFNSENLEPGSPESLVYYKDGDTRKLAGVMFYTDSLSTEGEQVGGPLTLWHYHPHWDAEKALCFRKKMSQRLNIKERSCPENSTQGYRTPEMMHVWFIRHPEGQFASRMTLDKKVIQREPEKLNRTEFINHTEKAYREHRKKTER